MKELVFLLGLLLLSACTSYGKISNQHISASTGEADYSIRRAVNSSHSQDLTLVLAFSGGGTRAAALAYGVLTGLRDSPIRLGDQPRRLLDEIDLISSVSGGSFTAAYFGLNGDAIFTEYEENFLRRNVQGELMHGLFNPGLWFSKRGRTEMAVDYYENKIFKGATFADLYKMNGPLIVINATDLGRGVRFSFLQDYFNLICSDLASFPVSRAVTASSAVPVLFNPVVLRNHDGCDDSGHRLLLQARQQAAGSDRQEDMVEGLISYALKQERQYIHLVDGGVSDNLGLMAIHEMVELAGGARKFLQLLNVQPASRFVVISVNASTSPQYNMELSNKVPSLEDTVNAMSDAQLHLANASTLELFKQSMQRWSTTLSTEARQVRPYFIEIDFNSIPQRDRRFFFNQIPVSFSLNKTQVDDLIEAGRELLVQNAEFQRLLNELQ